MQLGMVVYTIVLISGGLYIHEEHSKYKTLHTKAASAIYTVKLSIKTTNKQNRPGMVRICL